MHERRRFLIALSGIGICLLIAAGILFTTPAVLVLDAPSPRAAVMTLPAPLPRLAVPVVPHSQPPRQRHVCLAR